VNKNSQKQTKKNTSPTLVNKQGQILNMALLRSPGNNEFGHQNVKINFLT